MFEDSTFESAGRIHTRSRRWMIAAFTLNSSILLALILIPLIHPEALPRQLVPFLMVAPPTPTVLEQPKPLPTHSTPVNSEMPGGQVIVPTSIPHIIIVPNKPEPEPYTSGPIADLGPEVSAPAGPGQGFPSQSVRPVVRPEHNGPVRVPSAIVDGLLIRKTVPTYPPLGHSMRVEGTVVLAATISKTGTIENLRVVSGPPMLQQAALDAVKTWLYRPYLLNREPIEVETTVNVIFTLNR
jgi:protein TonB